MKLSQLLIFTSFLSLGLHQKIDNEPLKLQYRQQSEAYLVENLLSPSEQDVPLEDFFWTGSGDGPLYLKPKDTSSSGSKYPTIVRTATILATVFIDGNFDEFDPLCVYDCDKKGAESGLVESIDRIPPSDRRYWLLTVVAGLFSSQDFPILEEKLAKLYRIAFLRQQAKHLGIVNGNATIITTAPTQNSTNVQEPVTRKKRYASEISPTKTLNASEEKRTRRFEINKHVYERQVLRMKRHRVPVKRESPPPTRPPVMLKLPAPYEIIYKSDDKSKNKKLKSSQNFMQKVSVMIHKLAHDEEEGSDTNKLETNLVNQTEIIYSVIVGGKPILATTAADDMRLVSTDEVIKIMENDVVLKAEPYLREPMATPLVPSKREDDLSSSSIAQNPILIALSILALILFILLLLTLLLYGRSKRRLAAEAKRQSATQALVHKMNVDDDINTIRSNSLEEIGVENFAFEKENIGRESVRLQKKEPPVLTFPLPPATRPSSSTSTTSDSSVYYPKRRYKFSSIQDLLDDKDIHPDEIYTKLKSSTNKSKKKDSSKVHKHRHRRKLQNRVGSVEQINSDADIVYNDDSLMHNEALNPHVSHYNANKLMTDKSFTVIERKSRKKSSGGGHVEAINQELLLQQQKGRIASADSNSIGSFLSMASIRSFPKCSVTEPLNRILEPVSVTHLDHSDADYETLKNYRMMDSQKSLDIDNTQSDGADPGVLGPIVWELHKKGMDVSTNSLASPMRDPHTTRNRFEGLLEGAMKLYSSSSYSNCHSLMNQQEDDQLGQMPGVIKSKEARGKSAATIRLTSRTSGLLTRADFHPARPKTADQPDLQLQNPLPTIHAWSGSGSNLRPMSAGVYHKPEIATSENDRVKIDRNRAMSASPIIDAIQQELKRISNEK